MKLSRRRFIQSLTAVALLPNKVFAQGFLSRNSFKVPRLDLGKRDGKNVTFDLNIQSGFSQFFAKFRTPTLGINQNFLGVTLRANKGDTVHINVKNSINKTTTLHWHGMKLPAKADGGPHQPIKPNNVWKTKFDIIQEAATLWYHSHQIHKTGEQVYNGLAGLFIIDDEQSKKLNLPSTYGEDDFPVIIQDRKFNKNGTFAYLQSMPDRMMGQKGDVVLVNGVYKPVLKVKKTLIRLRLLNGSNSRIYHLSFSNNKVFTIIASDGGLLEQPIKNTRLVLAPAERVEILVEVFQGEIPVLQHKSPDNPRQMMMGMMSRMMGGDKSHFNIMQIVGQSKEKIAIPNKLVKHKKISQIDNKRNFNLQMKMGPQMMSGGNDTFSINDKTMDMNRIDEIVKAGSSEIWRIRNSSMMAHPFHIHNVQFKIISRRGGVKGHELGFKDVVLVHPNETVEVVMQFPQFSDKNTPYMYHCHILEHEDRGMMGQFVVV
jgi:bilirubin oxidase